MRSALVAVALGLTLHASDPGAAGAGAAAAIPRQHVVTIDASRFQPSSLTVAPGDIVIFRNIDMFPHTATSRLGVFDSKEIQPGKSWKYTVPKKGLFEYFCALHPTMKAALRVR